jgi:methionyl-tRNA synthetase
VPPEVWRYYLLVNRPESSDTNFLWDDFQAKNNSELLGKLGNFVNRALKFIEASFNSELPPVGPLKEVDNKLIAAVDVELKGYLEAMERVSLKDALRYVMSVSELGNCYLQAEQPWVLIKTDPARCASVIGSWLSVPSRVVLTIVEAIATNLVRLLVSLCDPFMPSFSSKVREQLKLPLRPRLPEVRS